MEKNLEGANTLKLTRRTRGLLENNKTWMLYKMSDCSDILIHFAQTYLF